jgi:hypothetical protein
MGKKKRNPKKATISVVKRMFFASNPPALQFAYR